MTDLESPGPWPDDALTVTYGEIRQLIALHLDRLGDTLGRVAPWEDAHRTAKAMRDGATPLLIREVLSPPEPERPLPGLADGPFDGEAQARASATLNRLLARDGVTPELLDSLRRLGDHYGPLGVALTAARLTDPAVVVARLTEPGDLAPSAPREGS